MLFPLLVIAASSLWGMYLAYRLGRWHGEQATMSAMRYAITNPGMYTQMVGRGKRG